MKGFGARLQTLRRQAGMSQQDLADQLHVSRQSVSKWELGTAKPDLDNVIRLSELFSVSLDELVLGKIPHLDLHSVQQKPEQKSAKRMWICLILGVLYIVLAFALLPVHQLFDQQLHGNWYTSAWVYLTKMPHNILLIAGAALLFAAYWNKRT